MTSLTCHYNQTTNELARCTAQITNYEPVYIATAVLILSAFVLAIGFISYIKMLQKLREFYIEWFKE